MEIKWYNDLSHQFMMSGEGYIYGGKTINDIIQDKVNAFSKYESDKKWVDRFREYICEGFFSLSTPIWSNYGNARGLPISCYGSTTEDSIDGILYSDAEIGKMTKVGGGTAIELSRLRPLKSPITDNGYSFGPCHFAKKYDCTANIISQGSTRRGNCALYLNVKHKDIMLFLDIGSENSEIQNSKTAVCCDDDWMEEMIAGDREKQKIWAKILESRTRRGYPYIFFTGNANKYAADCYKNRFPINHSQLCAEIALPTNDKWSFVCCLLSMNIRKFDEWKHDKYVVKTAVRFLDSVMTEFIDKTQGMLFMDRARNFAIANRALGIGWLGWHSYLQHKNVPFDSMEAYRLNYEVAKHIHDNAYEESQVMGKELGCPEVCEGFGRRHTTLLAIAPTVSSSFILGQTSKGIDPITGNMEIKDLAKGKYTIKNRELEDLLESKGQNTPETWKIIRDDLGSVSKLDCLTEHEKEVFRTAWEISPTAIIQQASQRQKFIDQGQSINLYIDPRTPTKQINAVTIEAWKLGLKSLYYQKGLNMAQETAKDLKECKTCEA